MGRLFCPKNISQFAVSRSPGKEKLYTLVFKELPTVLFVALTTEQIQKSEFYPTQCFLRVPLRRPHTLSTQPQSGCPFTCALRLESAAFSPSLSPSPLFTSSPPLLTLSSRPPYLHADGESLSRQHLWVHTHVIYTFPCSDKNLR